MILRAAWVVPVTAPPIRDGIVRIDGDRIVEVAAASTRTQSREIVDLGQAVLLPGFVNPHTHLELTCYADKLEPGPLWPWLERLVALRREPGALERERQAVSDGAERSLRAGVTCVGDISRLNIHWEPLKRSPIRKVCYVELLSIARLPPRNPDELREALRMIDEDGLLTAGVSVHAAYTVPAAHIRAAIALADELHRPWCMHWAETREELSFLRGSRGVLPAGIEALCGDAGIDPREESPAALLERCCNGLSGGALAHVNYVNESEIRNLLAHVVMYCPRAHAFFGHELHPVMKLRSAGVRVALATDSLASNQSLSMLDEMQFLSRARPDLSSADLLAMGTIDAARALGLGSEIGSIEKGKLADLTAVVIPPGQAEDPVDCLVRRGGSTVGVWVAGRRVIG